MPTADGWKRSGQTEGIQVEENEVLSTEEEVVTPEETTQEPVQKSMDDTIRETLEAIESRDDPEKVDGRKTRERGVDGKYLPKQDVASEVVEEVQPEPTPVTIPPELQKLGLRKEEAEAIAANPVAMQAIMRRSEEMHKGLEQYRSKAQFGDAMMNAVQPYMATIQGLGVSPDVAVQKLMAADHNLRYGSPQQKTQMLMQIAGDYGIDLHGLQNQAEQQYVDPRIQTLEQQIQQQNAWIQQQNQQREWQERQALNSEIAAFQSDPANVHFEDVRNEMAGLLQAGLAPTLKQAYEMAIYANPTIRAKVLAEQQTKAEEARRAEVAAKAQEAKRAASVNVSRKGTMPPARRVGSMDETIRAEAERLGII